MQSELQICNYSQKTNLVMMSFDVKENKTKQTTNASDMYSLEYQTFNESITTHRDQFKKNP